jgi:alpha-beta hydrolase superfamily lysophospholipase
LLIVLVSGATIAQDETDSDQPAENPAIEVRIEAEDGLNLWGAYFPPRQPNSPAVLLLHQLYTTHTSWTPLIYPLLEQGYAVLAVDLRGYGATRGALNWGKAQTDTGTWLNWLSQQEGVRRESVFVVGASMGSNLALNGCAESDLCAGSVAISPGRRYFGVITDDAILSGAPTLLIYSDRDGQPARDVPVMLQMAQDAGLASVDAQVYAGRIHGVSLFRTEEDLIPTIINWLNAHRR